VVDAHLNAQWQDTRQVTHEVLGPVFRVFQELDLNGVDGTDPAGLQVVLNHLDSRKQTVVLCDHTHAFPVQSRSKESVQVSGCVNQRLVDEKMPAF